PAVPNARLNVPVALNSCTRLFAVSATYKIPAPLSNATPDGWLNCPLPDPDDPKLFTNTPLTLNTSTRLFPPSLTNTWWLPALPVPNPGDPIRPPPAPAPPNVDRSRSPAVAGAATNPATAATTTSTTARTPRPQLDIPVLPILSSKLT